MSVEAYYPKILKRKNIDEKDFKDLIMDINLEIGRFDGILKYNPQKEIVKAFLRAEEVLSASWLEVREIEFGEYLNKLLDRSFESEDIVIMKRLIDNYDDLLNHPEKEFSLDYLNKFHEYIYNNRASLQIPKSRKERHRQTWLINHKEELDILRLYQFENESKTKLLMDNLNQYINSSKFHPYITIAIAYAQIAMINPWYYANNRTIGALIPSLFEYYGFTNQKVFFINSALRKCKDEFFEQLYQLLINGTWNQWIEFFLNVVKEQAISYQKKTDWIVKHYDFLEKKILAVKFSDRLTDYLDIMLAHPIFSRSEINKKYNLANSLLNPYINYMLAAGFLDKDCRKSRNNCFFTGIYAIMEL